MTRLSIAAALFAAVVAGPALAAGAPLDGNWARGDGNAKVVIKPCGSDVCAVNTWIKPGHEKEKVGDKLVMTIDQDSENSYSGKAFDPQRNMTYKLSIDVSAKAMTTKGCVLGGILCKSQQWTRIN
ncbi:DUF2147 domain-containing protein [Rhizobium halophytocola]|uniref:Uncharacterized protein (DUF2147 family) n=1 Tax=Rhizobium halophytocola TaxID=735519 RepID=A0ABS4E0H3_9HYPH|nr:DUF2147 domain-containing protein [Rhizobium halophytocola]MBP1851444.1 uncharacterized protein (DUF2147 family) [Rhizobium halophytocola]